MPVNNSTRSSRPRRWLHAALALSLALPGAVVALASEASAGTLDALVITTAPASLSVASGATLSFTVTAESSPGVTDTTFTSNIAAAISPSTNAQLAGTTTVAATSGVANFTLTVNARAATNAYTITFSSGTNASSVASSLITVTPGVATTLVVTTQPSPGQYIGSNLVTQPVVTAQDSGGNVAASGASGTVTATVAPGTCSIVSGLTATFTNSVATFSGMQLSGASGDSCTLSFNGSSLPQVSASAVLLSNAASQMVSNATLQASTKSGAPLSPLPSFLIEDSSGTQVKILSGGSVTASFSGTTPAGASLTNASASIVNGAATFSGFAVNAIAGTYSINFSSSYGTVTASITVIAGDPYKLVVKTQPSSSVPSGTAFAAQPVIEVADSGGNLVSSSAVVTATLSSGTGTLINATATASSGTATFSGLAVNALIGSGYSLRFSAPLLQSVISNAFSVTIGQPSQLVITTSPGTTAATGTPLTPTPVVKVEDAGGNVITNIPYVVTATLSGSPAGTVSNAATTTVNGVATFTNLIVNGTVGGTYTLSFAASGLTSVTTNPFSITSGTAIRLSLTTAPSSTVQSGVTLPIQPVVKVVDGSGNVVTSNVSSVTARLTSGGVSLANATVTTVNGVATFAGLAINAKAGTYTLTFTDGALGIAVSGAIVVSVGPASQLVVTQEPSTFAPIGAPLAVQPIITVEDTGGNVVTSINSGSVVAAIAAGTGGTLSAGSVATFVAGVAKFTGLTLSGATGVSYQLKYTGAGFTILDGQRISIGQLQSPLVIKTTKAWMGRTLTLKTKGGDGTGAVSYSVSSQGTTKCTVSGSVLSYKKKGTCVVVATKAASGNYASVTSAPASIVVAIRPKPRPLNLGFKLGTVSLAAHQTRALTRLANKLSRRSLVKIVVYEPFNRQLAQARGLVIRKFLLAHVPAHARIVVVINTRLHRARLITLRQ